MSETEPTCCTDPSVRARWTFGSKTDGSAYCKNCDAGWRYCPEEKKLMRYPALPPNIKLGDVEMSAETYSRMMNQDLKRLQDWVGRIIDWNAHELTRQNEEWLSAQSAGDE